MVVLPSAGASCYHNYCIDFGISPEYFGSNFVYFIRDRPLLLDSGIFKVKEKISLTQLIESLLN
jgi:hypothetical protein